MYTHEAEGSVELRGLIRVESYRAYV